MKIIVPICYLMRIRQFLAHRGGIAVWRSEYEDHRIIAPLLNEDGTPHPAPFDAVTLQPELIITTPEEIGVVYYGQLMTLPEYEYSRCY